MTEEETQIIAKIIENKFNEILLDVYPERKLKIMQIIKEIQLEYANQLQSIMKALEK